MNQIKRALISVSDKSGLAELAAGLEALGIEIISTGGTASLLREKGIPVKDVSEVTHFPEMLDGRVKTLHPVIHGGLLAKRDNPAHLEQIKKHNIATIDMVVVNLYPFEKTISSPGSDFEKIIENIDIGGPTMLRSAAKNFQDVAVIVDPADYSAVLTELQENNGSLSPERKFALAQKVFRHTADYDGVIADYLSGITVGTDRLPLNKITPCIHPSLVKVQDLRYGENPHQLAAFYQLRGTVGLPSAVQLQGKELSFNNILDIDAAFQIARDFNDTVAVIIKHNNPCGVAIGESLAEAYVNAREADPLSAFGGVLGFNRKVDSETALEIISTFVEAIIAPDYDPEALNIFQTKKNLRLLRLEMLDDPQDNLDLKKVAGGILVQERDNKSLDWSTCQVVTERKPTDKEGKALRFAWKVVKHVKSNAIVFANECKTLGIGAGQMSRVDSSRLAVMKARSPLTGSALASDAFFPFRDGIDAAAEAGATAIIQPGGSLKDDEVINAANEQRMAMIFTGMRHFKH
ncbi:MAG: bifunctional phosphoribosylaminoimidazolecarboxamide formyltransferase/IMP cyclohydrolase [Candidatus Schekmanbacteria bacterium]|nr:bifunctional phosphoribosylaminoimidazolecarboxamide formyltransferase/IMP cyclohydrolase [Candidatus Schekmanbacteria bacterium]